MLGHRALPSPLPQLLWLTERCCQGYHLLILVRNFQPRRQAWCMSHTWHGHGRVWDTCTPQTHKNQQQQQDGFMSVWLFVVNESTYNGVRFFFKNVVFTETGGRLGKWGRICKAPVTPCGHVLCCGHTVRPASKYETVKRKSIQGASHCKPPTGAVTHVGWFEGGFFLFLTGFDWHFPPSNFIITFISVFDALPLMHSTYFPDIKDTFKKKKNPLN